MKKFLSVSGKVIRGKDQGKQLGFPTANIKLPKNCQIKSGVYAVKVYLENKVLDGVAFLKPQGQILETHLFDFSNNLYGKKIKADFFKRLREAKRFEDDRELKSQIKKDCKLARQILKSPYREMTKKKICLQE